MAGWRRQVDRGEWRLILTQLSSNDSATAVFRSTVDRSTGWSGSYRPYADCHQWLLRSCLADWSLRCTATPSAPGL